MTEVSFKPSGIIQRFINKEAVSNFERLMDNVDVIISVVKVSLRWLARC